MAQEPIYGPDNPHPLSTMRTELVWEGKYDEYGRRRTVDAASLAMPLQHIERIDQPRDAAAADGQLELFEQNTTRNDDFRNRLIWGDNKLVMASLLEEFRGKVDLIYIDPPFDVGADFTMDVPVGDGKEMFSKDQSALEFVAYRDTWGRGVDSYVNLISDRISLMRSLLRPGGSIFVHCDYRVGATLKQLLDEIFGITAFRNHIVWLYSGGGIPKTEMPKKHDDIYWYTNGDKWTFNTQYRPYSEGTVERGRTSVKGDIELREEGTPINNWWPDVKKITSPTDYEKLYYPTQKSEELLARVISMCSNTGDLVADFFCGSGTTGAVAEKLGRRWIMSDLGRFAVHTSRKRLIDIQRTLAEDDKPYRAFDVYNLGRYERQWWQAERLKGADEDHRRTVLQFFGAEIVDPAAQPSPLIHGRKAGAVCHVDGIDSIFTRDEAVQVAGAATAAGATMAHCLAWEFEMEIQTELRRIKKDTGVTLKAWTIPREIMEKNRKVVPFFEVAHLAAEAISGKGEDGKWFDIRLTDFMPSLAEVPEKELESLQERAMNSPFDFIDFWAVDFDWHPDRAFNHHWQDFRTRRDRSLKIESDSRHVYKSKGKKTICVKVVDTFGCDTSVTVEVKA